MEKVLVIIPAYNEAENIERVVENLKDNYNQFDYIVVNDGSKDNTAEICRQKNYNLLDLPINLGLAGAFQAGVKYANENDYDAVIQYDGDGQHEASFIQAMVDKMEKENCDIVIGSRFVDFKKPFSLRMLGSRMITLAIKLTTGQRVSDPTSGMRLFNKRTIDKIANNINYGPEPDTISYLISCGSKVSEVQVTMHERIAGESYLNIPKSVQYMMNMFFSILFIQFFRPKK